MVFFDIFSNKKEKTVEQQKIIADYREKSSLVVSHLLNMPIEIKFDNLQIGDYLINNLVIERKTFSDFKSSIIDKRLFNQIKNLQQCPSNLLILENAFEEKQFQSKIKENAIRGVLLSILLKYKIPVLFTLDAKDTAEYIRIFSLKKEKSVLPTRHKKIILTEQERQEFILEGFIGIGPATSKKLLSHFGSLYNIFTAKKEELFEVLGKKTEAFYSLLHLNSSNVV